MSRPERGRIVLAELLDPQGRNPKPRPVVIVTATEEIQPGQPFLVVAITGTFPTPLPQDCVPLPWHANRHPKTGLRKPSVAACSWYVEITEANILEYKGRVPDREMLTILTKLAEIITPPPAAGEPLAGGSSSTSSTPSSAGSSDPATPHAETSDEDSP